MAGDRADLESTHLQFLCVATQDLDRIDRDLAGCTLLPSLEAAQRACAEEQVILAVSDGTVVNLDPFRRVEDVAAAGGIIVREEDGAIEVLLIYRRGAWDLPKGKQDEGESLPECALREVREEVGISHLDLLDAAGTTVHGYPERDRYIVKRTHWYLMTTPETTFDPESAEGIEQAEWVPWTDALDRLGYETLQEHLARLGQRSVRSALSA